MVRAAVAAGRVSDAAWAGPLVQLQPLASAFVELLRPLTIFDKLQPRMRRAPFEIRFPRQTAASSVGWLAEGKPAAFSALAFESLTFGYAKLGGMVAVQQRTGQARLARRAGHDHRAPISWPRRPSSTDVSVSESESSAGVPGEAPASITFAGPKITASGTDADAFRADSSALVAAMAAAGAVQFKSPPIWVMSETQKFALDVLDPALVKNGQIGGWDVMTSSVVATSASPPVGDIHLVDPSQVTYADAGMEIDGSQEATIELAAPPDSPATASTVMMSLFEYNLAAVKITRYVNWAPRAGCPAGSIVNAAYGLPLVQARGRARA